MTFLNLFGFSFLFRDKFQCLRIYAVSQSGGRGAILKDMSEMGTTAGAGNFNSDHSKTGIFMKIEMTV